MGRPRHFLTSLASTNIQDGGGHHLHNGNYEIIHENSIKYKKSKVRDATVGRGF